MSTPTNPVELAEAKQHLGIVHSDRDDAIQIALDAATESFIGVDNYLGIDPTELTDIPAPIRQAILLKTELLFDTDLPDKMAHERSIDNLVDPYRVRRIG